MKEEYEELMNWDEDDWDEISCQSLDMFREYCEETDHERTYGDTRDD